MLVGSNTKPVGHAVPAVTTPITVTSMGGVLIQLSLARRAMRAGLNNRSSSSSSSLYHILAHGGPHNTRNAVPKWTQHGWLAGCDTFSLTASPHPSARRSLRRSCQDISFPVSLVSCLCCFASPHSPGPSWVINALQGPLSQSGVQLLWFNDALRTSTLSDLY